MFDKDGNYIPNDEEALEFEEFDMDQDMIKIGTRVVMNCGAGIPEELGVIISYSRHGSYVIEYEDGTMDTAYTIKSKGETSVNGSPIGVFVDE